MSLHNYKYHFLVFTLSLAYFGALTAPDMTWVNVGSDSTTYLASAKFLVLNHPTGAPLYTLLNWLIVRIPLGSEFWRLAIMSAIASACTATLLWHITRNWLAPAIFLASGVVVSQSTIPETYALITLLMVLMYYFHIKGMSRAKYIIGMVGIGIHHLIGFTIMPTMAADFVSKKSLKPALLLLPSILFYLYIPIAARAPWQWIPNDSFESIMKYYFGQSDLVGGLAVWPPESLLHRLQDGSMIILGGFALALIPIVLAIRNRFKTKQLLLPFLFILPIIYYLTNLAPQVFTYTMPAFAFGALLACEIKLPKLKIPITVTALALMLINIQLYDIGRTLDPNLNAKQYYNELWTLPSNAVIWNAGRGWEVQTAFLYNLEGGKATSLSRMWYTDKRIPESLDALRQARSEQRLYKTIVTIPEEYKVEIIPWQPTDLELAKQLVVLPTDNMREVRRRQSEIR